MLREFEHSVPQKRERAGGRARGRVSRERRHCEPATLFRRRLERGRVELCENAATAGISGRFAVIECGSLSLQNARSIARDCHVGNLGETNARIDTCTSLDVLARARARARAFRNTLWDPSHTNEGDPSDDHRARFVTPLSRTLLSCHRRTARLCSCAQQRRSATRSSLYPLSLIVEKVRARLALCLKTRESRDTRETFTQRREAQLEECVASAHRPRRLPSAAHRRVSACVRRPRNSVRLSYISDMWQRRRASWNATGDAHSVRF